jgi:hypothetical protein
VLTPDEAELEEAVLTREQMPSQPDAHQGRSESYVPSYAIARKGLLRKLVCTRAQTGLGY